MTIRETLKSYFQTGLRPTQANFEELIDKTVNLLDDKADATQVIDVTNDIMFVTPKGAKKVVDTYAVTKVNNVSPTNGNITLTSISGNAGTATKLATPRTINGISFDGSANISITTISGNSGTATKLAATKNINGVAFDGSTDIFVQKILEVTGSNGFSSSSTTRANVTGLSFAVLAGKKYKIELIGDYQTTDLATGGSLGFIMISGAATIKGNATMETSITSANNLGLKMSITSLASASAPGSFITSTGVSAINSPHNLSANLVLSCNTSGVFQVQWGSEVDTSPATLNSGTVLLITQLN
jgi:hypothetical protein